jgi:hypothetical protein
MTSHTTHPSHDHVHRNCEHQAVKHAGHTDYLHDGHLHNVHGDHVDEHRLDVDATNPDVCTVNHECSTHDKGHQHSAACGHAAVPHGDRTDFLVNGHIHHPHGEHNAVHRHDLWMLSPNAPG